MLHFMEMLPVLSGALIGLYARFAPLNSPAGRLFWCLLCLIAGVAVNRLSGEGLQWLPADVLSTLIFAGTFSLLLRQRQAR